MGLVSKPAPKATTVKMSASIVCVCVCVCVCMCVWCRPFERQRVDTEKYSWALQAGKFFKINNNWMTEELPRRRGRWWNWKECFFSRFFLFYYFKTMCDTIMTPCRCGSRLSLISSCRLRVLRAAAGKERSPSNIDECHSPPAAPLICISVLAPIYDTGSRRRNFNTHDVLQLQSVS